MKPWIRSTALATLLGTVGAAQPSVHISIPLPPPIVFHVPPSVVILPQTQVYVVPDLTEEVFFHSGWWWRPWQGRWYRSHYYDRGWAHYSSVPSWYRGIPPGWRNDYRDHRWGNGAWNHRPIPHDELHRNWKVWHDTRHWEQPQHRQHENRRDGRPYASHGSQGGKPEPNRNGHGEHPVRKPDPAQVKPVQPYPPVHGYPDPGKPPKAHPEGGKPNKGHSEGGNPNKGHSGGSGKPQEPKRDPH